MKTLLLIYGLLFFFLLQRIFRLRLLENIEIVLVESLFSGHVAVSLLLLFFY